MKNFFKLLTVILLLLAICIYAVMPTTQVGEFWAKYHFTSLQLIQPAIERYISPTLWNPYFVGFLTSPLWQGVLGLSGLTFLISSLFKE